MGNWTSRTVAAVYTPEAGHRYIQVRLATNLQRISLPFYALGSDNLVHLPAFKTLNGVEEQLTIGRKIEDDGKRDCT